MRPLIPLVLTRAVVAAASAPASCRLLLARHGETNYNAAGRIQGRLESELTQTGLEQAEKLGAWVDASSEALAVDRVFVSPKRRTRQTLAGIESAQRAPLPAAEVRPGLREIELTEGRARCAATSPRAIRAGSSGRRAPTASRLRRTATLRSLTSSGAAASASVPARARVA